MFVNQFKINLSIISTGTTANYINIPINMEYQIVDNAELIERVFVDSEIQKSINPIIDYEKVRFLPIDITGVNLVNMIYAVTFLSGTRYSDIGFNNDDIKFEKNSFKETFLKLSFYDTPNPLDQRLISTILLYPHLMQNDLYDNTAVFPNIPGQPRPANQIFVRFTLSSPIINPRGNSEGYYLYEYKDEVTSIAPKELFMKATFNNAKTGKSTNLMVDNTPHTIDNLINKLHTKYVLTRNSTGFFYEIDSSYSTNVSYIGSNVTVNLYEIQVL